MKEIYRFAKFLSIGILIATIIMASIFFGNIIINGVLQFDLPTILAILVTIVILVNAYVAYVLSKIKLNSFNEKNL